MKIIDVCKEYVYEPEEGVKIYYRKMPPTLFMGLMLNKITPIEMGKMMLNENGELDINNKDEIDRIRFNAKNTFDLTITIVEHPNSIVKWEGIQDEDGNELEFKPERIKGLSFNILSKLYNLIIEDSLISIKLDKKKV